MENKEMIQIFSNNEFGEIRIVEQNGNPYFVAKDISDILGYSDTNKMTNRLDDDEKITAKIACISKTNPTITIISESGLYNAVLGSQNGDISITKS